MMAQKSGKIINITSTSTKAYSPRMAVYAGCKAAVVAFSRCIAAELGPYGIHVNCVAPHAIVGAAMDGLPDKYKERVASTNALRKVGQPEEIANMVLFLASYRANYITGQQYCVDGGFVLNP